jgi:diaminobutyrate-2-oxoglutarate transaminase
MSIVLLRRDLDIWTPGEHNGTFRGSQLAFVGAAAALRYREKVQLEEEVARKAIFIQDFIEREIMPLDERIRVRGMGMIWGIDLTELKEPDLPKTVTKLCFKNKLIVELVGRKNQVLKILPPLTIELNNLKHGLEILRDGLKLGLGTMDVSAQAGTLLANVAK